MTALAVFTTAGITERQLGHWIRQGYLHPVHVGGSGHPREWPWQEIRVALLMKRLTDAGFGPAKAAVIARRVETTRSIPGFDGIPVTVDLGGGVRITIDTTTHQAAA